MTVNVFRNAALALALVATTVGGAMAQGEGEPGQGRRGGGQGQGRGGFGGFGGGFGFGGGQRGGGLMQPTIGTMPMSVLEKALALKPEQKTKIEEIQKKSMEEMRSAFGGFGGGGQRPDPEEMRARFEKMAESRKKVDSDIMAVLDDNQKKQAESLIKDAAVYGQAQLPLELAGELNLTDDQKKQITEMVGKIQKAMQTKMQEARENQDFESMREVMQQGQQALREKTRALLTADQKAKVEKWEKDNPRGRGGFGGFGRGQGGPGGAGAPGGGGRQRGNNGNPPPAK
ncbi:MAG: hypothetical protein ACOVT5_11730 [Armatimonadaceae bacterium]